MRHFPPLFGLNVALITVFVALLLGCGGDPEDPPKGSTEEKLCGEWVSDPIPLLGGMDGTTTIELDISFWNFGLKASYPEEQSLKRGGGAASSRSRYSASGFTIAGQTATSDPKQSGDGSTWVFHVDPAFPGVLYASWWLKDGTKRLDEMKFGKRK